MNISKELYQEDLLKMGAALKEARTASGMTMQEVADKLGIQKSTVSKIEAGQWNAGAAFFIAFAKLYGLKWELVKEA